MSSVSLVLDSMPSHFGFRAGDWAGLFVSRVIARPLVEKFEGKYHLGVLSEVYKIESCTWRLILSDSEDYTASSLLSAWRGAVSHGHYNAVRFIRRASVVDRNTIDITCRYDYETIFPFLDSPWLWAGMDAASTLKVVRSDYGYELSVESDFEQFHSQLEHKRIVLFRDDEFNFSKSRKWVAAGLSKPLSELGTIKPIDIFFTLAPNTETTRCGPFLCNDAAHRIWRNIDQNDLLDTSWTGFSGADGVPMSENVKPLSDIITEVSYTDFFPNEELANIIRKVCFDFYGKEIGLMKSEYCDIAPEYSRGQTSADILPLVPNNSSPTSIIWDMLMLTDAFLDDRTRQRIRDELDFIEGNLCNPSGRDKVNELLDTIASVTGFGLLGRYRGFYMFNKLSEVPISDFGFIDFGRVLS